MVQRVCVSHEERAAREPRDLNQQSTSSMPSLLGYSVQALQVKSGVGSVGMKLSSEPSIGRCLDKQQAGVIEQRMARLPELLRA